MFLGKNHCVSLFFEGLELVKNVCFRCQVDWELIVIPKKGQQMVKKDLKMLQQKLKETSRRLSHTSPEPDPLSFGPKKTPK